MTVAMFICGRFTVEGNEDLFEQADAVTEALLDQERCTPEVRDSAVSADRSGRVMEIEVTVHAASEHEAIAIGHAAIRSAIHAVGGTGVCLGDLSKTPAVTPHPGHPSSL